jgi:hypothetical protein
MEFTATFIETTLSSFPSFGVADFWPYILRVTLLFTGWVVQYPIIGLLFLIVYTTYTGFVFNFLNTAVLIWTQSYGSDWFRSVLFIWTGCLLFRAMHDNLKRASSLRNNLLLRRAMTRDMAPGSSSAKTKELVELNKTISIMQKDAPIDVKFLCLQLFCIMLPKELGLPLLVYGSLYSTWQLFKSWTTKAPLVLESLRTGLGFQQAGFLYPDDDMDSSQDGEVVLETKKVDDLVDQRKKAELEIEAFEAKIKVLKAEFADLEDRKKKKKRVSFKTSPGSENDVDAYSYDREYYRRQHEDDESWDEDQGDDYGGLNDDRPIRGWDVDSEALGRGMVTTKAPKHPEQIERKYPMMDFKNAVQKSKELEAKNLEAKILSLRAQKAKLESAHVEAPLQSVKKLAFLTRGVEVHCPTSGFVGMGWVTPSGVWMPLHVRQEIAGDVAKIRQDDKTMSVPLSKGMVYDVHHIDKLFCAPVSAGIFRHLRTKDCGKLGAQITICCGGEISTSQARAEERVLIYKASTKPGFSGSLVYSNNLVCGIHLWGSPTENGGMLLDDDLKQLFFRTAGVPAPQAVSRSAETKSRMGKKSSPSNPSSA